MDISQLIDEGHRIEKPCLLLDDNGADSIGVIGYWGGGGRSKPDVPPASKHWATFDCHWLERSGFDIKGTVGLYEVADKFNWPVPYCADYEPDKPLADLSIDDGTQLYGHESTSFPPIEALCLYGGPVVVDSLTSISLKRTDYDEAANTELGEQYVNEWLQRCPLYSKHYHDVEYFAVLGGWHIVWPEDDYYMPQEMQLIGWTFRDSEPWLEIWKRRQNFRVEMRIS